TRRACRGDPRSTVRRPSRPRRPKPATRRPGPAGAAPPSPTARCSSRRARAECLDGGGSSVWREDTREAHMTWISIGEICNKDVEYVTPETTVLRAAQLMRELHVGDLVIV